MAYTNSRVADPRMCREIQFAHPTGQTLFEICARLTLKHQLRSSRQAISQHLGVLEAAGLVESRRDGRYKPYLDTRPLEQIVDRRLCTNKEETT